MLAQANVNGDPAQNAVANRFATDRNISPTSLKLMALSENTDLPTALDTYLKPPYTRQKPKGENLEF
jgi:hypothetical protein